MRVLRGIDSCASAAQRRRGVPIEASRQRWRGWLAAVGAAVCVAGTASRATSADAPIPRAVPRPQPEQVQAVQDLAVEEANRQRSSVDRLRAAASHQTQQTVAAVRPGSDHRPDSAAPTIRFVYFTSRSCRYCDESLDNLVKAFLDRHPELAPEVIYLGNPLVEYPEASSVFVAFADDVIARWRERLRDPTVLEALKRAGKVEDTTGRVQVSFATVEAESRGIREVPAFLLRDGTQERVAVGRPANVDAFEDLLARPEGTER